MTKALTDEQVRKAIVDPASVFTNPMAVVDDETLSTECKIEILRRWEYDAKEMQVADEEGFPAREPGTLLDAVIAALHRLGAGPDLEHSPTTKQGGV
tara:strand:- start:3880 stop:4170 length:291 start_codon:yes stop_codon:yes gene_type:complete